MKFDWMDDFKNSLRLFTRLMQVVETSNHDKIKRLLSKRITAFTKETRFQDNFCSIASIKSGTLLLNSQQGQLGVEKSDVAPVEHSPVRTAKDVVSVSSGDKHTLVVKYEKRKTEFQRGKNCLPGCHV